MTKLDGSKWGDHAEGETFRKMILAASIDLRVLVIKLADRVHNLRTLGHHAKREKRERIARASMELLVPFAQRLGLYEYQRELEDLAFATLAPEAHERVLALVRQTEDDRRAALGELITGMRTQLAAAGVSAQVEARARHLYSIHLSLPGAGSASSAAERRRRGAALRPTDASRVVVVVNGDEGGLLRRARRAARPLAPGRRAGSATTSACPSTTCTVPCTPPSSSAASPSAC